MKHWNKFVKELHEMEDEKDRKEVAAVYRMKENEPKNNNKPVLLEVWNYLKIRKKWWLLPFIIVLLVVSFLIIFGGSALSPFVYALW